MFKYMQRRVLQAIPTFFGVTILSFLIILAAPGDPVNLITWTPDADPETAEKMRRQLGLDQPPLGAISLLAGRQRLDDGGY